MTMTPADLSARLRELMEAAQPGQPWERSKADANIDLAIELRKNLPTILRLLESVVEAEKALVTLSECGVPRPVGEPWRKDGTPSKEDKCVHQRRMWEDCDECTAVFALRALSTLRAAREGAR